MKTDPIPKVIGEIKEMSKGNSGSELRGVTSGNHGKINSSQEMPIDEAKMDLKLQELLDKVIPEERQVFVAEIEALLSEIPREEDRLLALKSILDATVMSVEEEELSHTNSTAMVGKNATSQG